MLASSRLSCPACVLSHNAAANALQHAKLAYVRDPTLMQHSDRQAIITHCKAVWDEGRLNLLRCQYKLTLT